MDTTISSATYHIDIASMQPVITRELKFKNGDTVSFTVTLPRDDQLTVIGMHQASVAHVIALLQGWSAPQ